MLVAVISKKVVKTVDPKAFVIVSEASEIAGQGFKKINDQ